MLFLAKSNLDLGIGEQNDYVEALKMVLVTRGQELEAVVNFNLAVAKLDEKIGAIPYDDAKSGTWCDGSDAVLPE